MTKRKGLTRRDWLKAYLHHFWCVECGDGEPIRPCGGESLRFYRRRLICEYCHWFQVDILGGKS